MADLPARKLLTARAVTQAECPWLGQDIPAGLGVYVYGGFLYRSVSPQGVPVTVENDVPPFFELPADALLDAVTGQAMEVWAE